MLQNGVRALDVRLQRDTIESCKFFAIDLTEPGLLSGPVGFPWNEHWSRMAGGSQVCRYYETSVNSERGCAGSLR